MAGHGRPNKYLLNVQPRLAEINEWLEVGATEAEVADRLGVNVNVFSRYKKEYPELMEVVTNARRRPVQEIKTALLKRAKGFYYTETTTVTSEKGVQTTTYNKYSVPDVNAAMILLRHWDKEDDGRAKWTADPAQMELKKEELEFKKQQADKDPFK